VSDLPNYDELVAVRLELARIRDHRDALQAGLTKEIRELIRSELSAQLDAVSCQLVERDDLKAENARLKAELDLIYSLDPMIRESVAYAKLEGRRP
jgi:hypothetical protein